MSEREVTGGAQRDAAAAPSRARGAPATHAAPRYDIPTRGIVCAGKLVELGWPEEPELDRLTALRNRPDVRAWFLDPRPLDPLANREWLRSGMRRPAEALLAVRLKGCGSLCGMVGWTAWSASSRAPQLGRIAVDRGIGRELRPIRLHGYPGIAVDAASALCDYFFERAGAQVLRSIYIAGNRPAARVNRLVGARIVRTTALRRADGTSVEVRELELTRAQWSRTRTRRPE